MSNGSLTLATASSPKTVLTSVEGPSIDNLIRLASTEELTWIDQRFTLRPVFGVKHARAWDRTLRVHSLMLDNSELCPIFSLTVVVTCLIRPFDVPHIGKEFVSHYIRRLGGEGWLRTP